MTTNYYQNLLLDLNVNHEHHPYEQVEQHLTFNIHHAGTSSVSSSSLCNSFQMSSPSYFIPPRDHGTASYCSVESKPSSQQHEVAGDVIPYSAASESNSELNGLKFTILKREDHNHDRNSDDRDHCRGSSNSTSIKWMSSKMGLIRKMMKSEEQASHNTNPRTIDFGDHNFNHVDPPKEILSANTRNTDVNSPFVRFCSDCNTTKTPLWRSGPQGPKSLCNACGIRQRKARRAAMAAISGTTAINGTTSTSLPNKNASNKLKLQNKEAKKRCKTKTSTKPMATNNSTHSRKVCFEEFALNLSKKVSLHQVFPPDEKEAAILLMAMSCGLVEG